MYVNRATLSKEYYESKTAFSAHLGKFRRHGGQATPVMREYKTGLRIVLRGNDAIIPRDYRKKILLELLWQQYSAWPFFLADFLRSTVLPVKKPAGRVRIQSLRSQYQTGYSGFFTGDYGSFGAAQRGFCLVR